MCIERWVLSILFLLTTHYSLLTAQSGNEVKNYPQGFSERALKALRSEIADSVAGGVGKPTDEISTTTRNDSIIIKDSYFSVSDTNALNTSTITETGFKLRLEKLAAGLKGGGDWVLVDVDSPKTILNTTFTGDANTLAFWPLDSAWCINNAITFGNDMSGSGLDLTMSYTSRPSSSLFYNGGNSIEFNGTSDYLTTSGNIGISGATDRTINAWVKVAAVPTGDSDVLVSFGANVTGQKYTLMINTSGQLRLEVNGGNAVATTNICDGQWHFVSCVLHGDNATDIYFYVDGVRELNSSSSSRAINTTNSAVEIGRGFVAGRYFLGELAFVSIYNEVKTSAEINSQLGQTKFYTQNNYNKGFARLSSVSGKQWQRDEFLNGYYVMPEWYGAMGDGVNDDAVYFNYALNSGIPLKLDSGSKYYLGSAITITDKDINISTLDGNKAEIIKSAAQQTFYFKGSAGNGDTTLSGIIYPNQDYFITSDASFFEPGNLAYIYSDSNGTWPIGSDFEKGELHYIYRIEGDTIYSESKTWDIYNTATDPYSLIEYKPITVELKDVFIHYPKEKLTNAIQIDYGVECVIDNIKIQGAENSAILLSKCFNTKIRNSYFKGANRSDLGYAIWLGSCYSTHITNNYFHGNLKAVDISAATTNGVPTRNTFFEGNEINAQGLANTGLPLSNYSARGIHSHPAAEAIYITNNTFIQSYYAAFVQAFDVLFSENKIRGSGTTAFYVGAGGGMKIVNNDYDANYTKRDTIINHLNNFVDIKSGYFVDSTNYLVVSNNNVKGLNGSFILANRDSIYNLTVKNNDVEFDRVDGGNIYLIQGGVKLFDANISDNSQTIHKGNFAFSNATFDANSSVNYVTGANFFYKGGIKIDSLSFDGSTWQNSASQTVTYLDQFSGTSTRDTLVVSGAPADARWFATVRSTNVTSNDVLAVQAKTDSVIVIRPSGGTSNLPYRLLWVKN